MITFRDNGAAFMMALQRLAPSTNCVASTLRDFSSRVPSTLDQSQHFIDSFRNIELNCFNVAVLLSSIQTPRVRIGNYNHHQVDGEKWRFFFGGGGCDTAVFILTRPHVIFFSSKLGVV